MDRLRITGGIPLRGEIKIAGAKNAALPSLAASILSTGTNTLRNVPNLMDIKTMGRLLESLGAHLRHDRENSEVVIDTSKITKYEAAYELVKTMRASIVVLGPLLARYGRASVSLPGGCAIGARPVNLHISALRKMGAQIEIEKGYIEAKADRLKGADIYFDAVTVTGTENIMMAAALARGTTIIENAAREPEVVDLANALTSMGAKIYGAGEGTIEIEGVEELKPFSHSVIPDRIEAGTYMTAAIITEGDVLLKGVIPEHLDAVIVKLKETGAVFEKQRDGLRVRGQGRPISRDIRTLPYPGFPTDMQAQFMSLMCIAEGTSIITETIFENRFMHAEELRRMGTDISISGSTATVIGVDALKGADVMATDLRASASLVIAGLRAEGTTTVHRIYHLDRGYERMEEKLRSLGASVERVR